MNQARHLAILGVRAIVVQLLLAATLVPPPPTSAAAAAAAATPSFNGFPTQDVRFVIESFDKGEGDARWTATLHNNRGKVDSSEVAVPPLILKGGRDDINMADNAIFVEYRSVMTETWGGFVSMERFFQDSPVSCVGADHVELEYKIIQPQSAAGRAHLRIILVEDSDTSDELKLERYYSFQPILDDSPSADWMVIKVPLVGDDDPTSPFHIPGWSGGIGNQVLDLEHIRGWSLEWNIDNVGDVGSFSEGSMLIRGLSCVQQLEVAAFHEPNMTSLDGGDLDADAVADADANASVPVSLLAADIGAYPATTDDDNRTRLVYHGSLLDSPLHVDRQNAMSDDEVYDESRFLEGAWHQTLEVLSQAPSTNPGTDQIFVTTSFEDGVATTCYSTTEKPNGTAPSTMTSAAPYNSTSTTTQTTFQVSLEYKAPRELYFNLTSDVSSLLLDVEWHPDGTNATVQQQVATVQLTVIGDTDYCDGNTTQRLDSCGEDPSRHLSTESSLSPSSQSSSEQPAPIRFRDFTPPTPEWRRIKGYRITFALSVPADQMADTSTQAEAEDLSGRFVISNLLTELTTFHSGNFSDFDPNGGDGELPTCNIIEEINADISGPQWRVFQFSAGQCCDICIQAGEDCRYYTIGTFRCAFAPYLDVFIDADTDASIATGGNGNTGAIGSSNATESPPPLNSVRPPVAIATNQEDILNAKVYWKDDTQLRGDFCRLCICDEVARHIDCRHKELRQIPKTFTPQGQTSSSASWKPLMLDLRQNPGLFVLGAGMLDAEIFSQLREIRLPSTIIYTSSRAFIGLSNLGMVDIAENEINDDGTAIPSFDRNTITDDDGIFTNICCSRRESSISSLAPTNKLSFCDIQHFKPGIDAEYEPFVEYVDASWITTLQQSSSFMAEAAESAEKCAEYCSIAARCEFFTYDARLGRAEHVCHLLENRGERQSEVCCNAADYADEIKLSPGFTSGYPPRTRHVLDDARVIILQTDLTLNEGNGYAAEYQLRLGAMPKRGAVWVDVDMTSSIHEDFHVSITPKRLALYDNETVATVSVRISDIKDDADGKTILVANSISSCDVAFLERDAQSLDGIVYVKVEHPVSTPVQIIERISGGDNESRTLLLAILIPLVCLLVVVGVYLYVEHKKRMADTVWQIQSTELTFGDPPEMIGQGTFGLVLLADYRGTQVAVKRVIPPSTSSSSQSSSMGVFRRRRNGSALRKSLFSSPISPRQNMSSSNLPPQAEWSDSQESNGSRGDTDDTQHTPVPNGEAMDLESGLRSAERWDETGDSAVRRDRSMDGGTASTTGVSKGRMSSVFMTKKTDSRKLQNDFISEMRHLSKLRHPNITTIMGAVLDHKDPLLVMEYMDHGSLYDVLQNETIRLEGEHILPILRDISIGIRFLHAAMPQVIHGDLKSHNILIDNRFRAKVADFGFSQKRSIDVRGTPYWMAPELLRKETSNNTATDVYSFGIILYEIYSRADPYEDEDYDEVIKLIMDPSVCKRPGVPSETPKRIRALMGRCLRENPSERPTFEELNQDFKKCDATEVDPQLKRTSMRSRKAASPQHDTDKLLYGVFPPHIAEALKAGRKVEPESHDLVTIFFSDIVGFTTLAATMTPLEISDLLDRLYHAFDDLSEKYDVFKVETIGDAYMACSNLVNEQEDHTKRIAQFAIDAVKVANRTPISIEDPSRGTVSIRVGFHSGPVVANIVGSRNPRYCLFGDTVNTASRMESHSMKNRIHCSDRSLKLLQAQDPDKDIPSVSRGNIEIKGKGKMKTHWVGEDKPLHGSSSHGRRTSKKLSVHGNV